MALRERLAQRMNHNTKYKVSSLFTRQNACLLLSSDRFETPMDLKSVVGLSAGLDTSYHERSIFSLQRYSLWELLRIQPQQSLKSESSGFVTNSLLARYWASGKTCRDLA